MFTSLDLSQRFDDFKILLLGHVQSYALLIHERLRKITLYNTRDAVAHHPLTVRPFKRL